VVESLSPLRRRPKLGGLETAAPCSPLAISRFITHSSSVIRLPAEASRLAVALREGWLAKAGHSTFGFRHLIHPSGSCRIRG